MPLDNLPARLFLVGCSNAVGGVYTNWFSRIFRDIQDLNPGFLIPKILDYGRQKATSHGILVFWWLFKVFCLFLNKKPGYGSNPNKPMLLKVLYFCFCQLSHGALIYSSVLRKMVDTEKFEQEAVASQLPPLAQNENDIGAYSKLMATFVDVFKGTLTMTLATLFPSSCFSNSSEFEGGSGGGERQSPRSSFCLVTCLMCLEEFLTLSRSYFPESSCRFTSQNSIFIMTSFVCSVCLSSADKKVQEAKARKRFESFDLNGDQQLDFTEFAQLKTGMHLHLSFNQGLLGIAATTFTIL
eukprot:g9993.t1